MVSLSAGHTVFCFLRVTVGGRKQQRPGITKNDENTNKTNNQPCCYRCTQCHVLTHIVSLRDDKDRLMYALISLIHAWQVYRMIASRKPGIHPHMTTEMFTVWHISLQDTHTTHSL